MHFCLPHLAFKTKNDAALNAFLNQNLVKYFCLLRRQKDETYTDVFRAKSSRLRLENGAPKRFGSIV